MVKHFRVGQSNELVSGEIVYDLHNLYDYVGCLLKGNRSFCLFFMPSKTHGTGHVPIGVEFVDVDILEFSPNFGACCVVDLEEMGYKPPSDRDDNWLLREDQATTSDHLFFRFASNAYIRVHSKQALIREGVILPNTADKADNLR
jgi:hypothetical protein